MKILVISTNKTRGGAARAAYRFAQGFKKRGHEVLYYTNDGQPDSLCRVDDRSPLKKKVFHITDFLPGYILSGFDPEVPFTLGMFGTRLDDILRQFKPDVIHVHWTWKGFVSFFEILRVSKNIPVYWTMHDASPFTGGGFYSSENSLLEKIRLNFLLKSLSKLNSHFRNVFIKGNHRLTFISPSLYLKREYENSTTSKILPVEVINNGIDTNTFKPLNFLSLRKKYGIDQNKRYILFGGVYMSKNPVKGGGVLHKIIKNISNYLVENNIGVISYGHIEQGFIDEIREMKLDYHHLGYIESDEGMAEVLNLANVFILPSILENYPFVVIEALSCGIPVVAFSVGGVPEQIVHGKNGYLAKPYDVENFSDGIKDILRQNKNSFKQEKNFSIDKPVLQYLQLFENSIKTGSLK